MSAKLDAIRAGWDDHADYQETIADADWIGCDSPLVQVPCTSLSCRGRRNGGAGFSVWVEAGKEGSAVCNECFCK